MLLNLNNCSVLKPQGYSSLQSISETERYELKNILTFAFRKIIFFRTSPRYTACWKGQCFGPLNQQVSSSLPETETSPSSTKPTPRLQSTFPPPTSANEGLFLCHPHTCMTRGYVGVFFYQVEREELAPASRNHRLPCRWSWHVLVRLEPCGESTEPSAGKDGTARHESGAGHNQTPERTI